MISPQKEPAVGTMSTKPNWELRTHCVAVRHHPNEIREIMVPQADVNKWVEQRERAGWTTLQLETRRMPVV